MSRSSAEPPPGGGRRNPTARRISRRRSTAVAPLLIAVAILFWHHGWLSRITDGIANPGDPLLTAWILAWDSHQLLRDPLRLFQGNIFYPHDDSLAFSEHLFAPALLVAPVQWASENPILAQNVSILLSQVLFAVAVFLLCRGFCLPVVPALLAALLAALAPVRMVRVGGHLHLLHFAWLPFLLHFLHRYFRTRRWRDVILAGLFLNAQLLSGYYLAVMGSIAAAAFCVMWFVRWPWRRIRRFGGRLLLVGAVTAALNLPFAVPYFRVSTKWRFTRSLQEAGQLSAKPGDFARRPTGLLFFSETLLLGPPLPERILYPGLGVILLAVVALAARKRKLSPLQRWLRSYFVVVGLLSAALALGPTLRIWGEDLPMPYRLFYAAVPGFKGLRAPARFGLLLDLSLCILAAVGVHWLLRRLRAHQHAPLPGVLAGILVSLTALERLPRLSGPPYRVETEKDVPAVYEWLANRPELGTVLFLPVVAGAIPSSVPWDTTPYREVYFSTYHWKNTINGVSGFVPPGYWDFAADMEQFPAPATIARIRGLPVDAVVIHRTIFPRRIEKPLLERAGFHVLYDAPEAFVLQPIRAPASGAARTSPSRALD